jgi:FkbM family methyltransferase
MGYFQNLVKQFLPLSWQKRWYHFKNPHVIDEVDIVYKLLRKTGDSHQTMIDVGAHIGSALEPFAKHGWQVYAFEPDPINRAKLLNFTKQYPNVKVEPIALSDMEVDEMPFFSSEVSSGISSLLNFHESHHEAAKVAVSTLKKYCEANKIEKVSFLKTDTEGYDLPVLRGNDWSKLKPRAIVCEFDDFKTKKLGYTLQEQAALLVQNGYKIIVSEWHPIEEYGRAHRWRRFISDPTKVVGDRVWGNIIAVEPKDWEQLVAIAQKYGPVSN